MEKKLPPLPQSLLDAAKKGEEEAKRPLSPKALLIKKRLERSLEEFPKRMEDPKFRARFRSILDAVSEGIAEEQRIMASLAPIPQRYRVKRVLVHETDERYVQERRVIFPEKIEVTYSTGSILVLRSIFVQVETKGQEGHIVSLWVWKDPDGWLIRPGVLDRYVRKGYLQKI